MKHKIKPIRDLYFRFIEGTDFDGRIDAQHVAACLQAYELIEYVPHNSRPTIEHYRDTDALRRLLERDDASSTLKNMFEQYLTDGGYI